MVRFRDSGSHARAMRLFSWIFFGGKARGYFLSWLAHGRIPDAKDVPGIVRQHGKFYDDGRLVRQASRPAW